MSRLLDIHKGVSKEVSDLDLIRRFEASVFDDVKIMKKKEQAYGMWLLRSCMKFGTDAVGVLHHFCPIFRKPNLT